MSITVSTIQTLFNTYVGDPSTDRISAAERLNYITEATVWLQENLKNDHQIETYDLPYIDTVNYYKVTTPLADLLQGSDLRRAVGENYPSMTHKSSRELAEEIAEGVTTDDSWAIERRDGQSFLVVNAAPKYTALVLDYFDNQTSIDNWTEDTTTSDALNAVLDNVNSTQGGASLEFDVDVSQSGNNRSTLSNTSLSYNLSAYDNAGVFLIDAYIPSVTEVTGYTLYWGEDASNYWSDSVTTDLDGSALANGWNTLAFEWSEATMTGTPDSDEDMNYFRIDLNYGAGQLDAEGFRYDYFRVAIPETLKFHYVSWNVGTNSSGTALSTFGATTDIPYFSGLYDQYKYAVAHMAASLAFDNLRLKEEALIEENRAMKALKRAKATFPSSVTQEVKNFKVRGVSFKK